MTELDKISTPRGEARSMTELGANGGYPTAPPGTGADWFGPQAPMRPLAPPEIAGRAFDYVPGYNLNTTPRAYEAIDFQSLRALAQAYDPLRLIIERRKDQICRLPWTIRLKHEGAGRRPKTAELSASTRGRIKDVTEFLKTPDYDVNFRSWLRALLEDLFVIDAPAVYCDRNCSGDLIGLRVVDGSTVKKIIGPDGRAPRPIRWTSQPFQWNGQTVTQENHRALGFRLVGNTVFPPMYQQILHGLPAASLTRLDLLYLPMNLRPGHVYGYSQCEQLVQTVSTAMRRATHQLEYYREGNQPESLYGLPPTWTPDQVQKFQDYWDNLFVGNLGARRRMKFMPGGGDYKQIREPPLKTDFDEWLVRIVCFAFSYPPSAFVTLSNRSIAEQHERQSEEEGIEPIKNWTKDLLDGVIADEFLSDDLEFAWVEEDEIDQEKQSTILSRYCEVGAMSLNEVREKLGFDPDPSPAANSLMVKTATGYVPIDNTNKEITA
ncbi:phage portal protein [Bradyrhizobium barranii subsp. apii]|uniref:phage portal protein n=1 Tax=Bradyrhizobium barranii TaxID=2992140 RepID=UPI001AA14841|nr:phage portal protein [Bradyrhizobium barranii]UPT97261.1 phage portal protein [Bradyrhizobium barranii subsp. apii]